MHTFRWGAGQGRVGFCRHHRKDECGGVSGFASFGRQGFLRAVALPFGRARMGGKVPARAEFYLLKGGGVLDFPLFLVQLA